MLRDSVTVEMRTDAPLPTVWRFLTAERDAWRPDMRFEAAVGSPLVESWTEDGVQATATGSVTQCDVPHLLAFEWAEPGWNGPLEVVIRLAEVASSTSVVLTEAGFVSAHTPLSLPDEHEAGWRYHLTRLRRVSEGDDVETS